MVALWPEARVSGVVGPLTTYAGFEEVNEVIVTEFLERLVTVVVSCFELPTKAVPKFKLLSEIAKLPPRG